jgi:hypothetical protein
MGPLFWQVFFVNFTQIFVFRANQGCQTDDLLVFDETFEPLIRESKQLLLMLISYYIFSGQWSNNR